MALLNCTLWTLHIILQNMTTAQKLTLISIYWTQWNQTSLGNMPDYYNFVFIGWIQSQSKSGKKKLNIGEYKALLAFVTNATKCDQIM